MRKKVRKEKFTKEKVGSRKLAALSRVSPSLDGVREAIESPNKDRTKVVGTLNTAGKRSVPPITRERIEDVHHLDTNQSLSGRTLSEPINESSRGRNIVQGDNIEGANTLANLSPMEFGDSDAVIMTTPDSTHQETPNNENRTEGPRLQNLQERRKIRRVDVIQGSHHSDKIISTENQFSGRSDTPQGNVSNIEFAYNNCKADLRDARRDKRVYAAFYESEKVKNEELMKEKCHLSQRISALEMMLGKKGKRFRRGNGRWSSSSNKKAAKDKYEGVFMALLHNIHKSANLSVTESVIDEESGFRIRNWNGSATTVSAQTARGALVYVHMQSGGKGLAHCSMELALRKEFYTLPFENISKYVHHRVKRLLQSPGFNYMSATMKDDCINIMTGDPEVLSRHRQSLSEAVSQRKKQAKMSYLKSLGYETVCKPVPSKKEDHLEEERRLERKEVHKRCVMMEEGKVNTMFWRVSKWTDICKPTAVGSRLASEMKSGDLQANKDGNVDMLFFNHSARLAFIEIRGYELPDSGPEGSKDVSILTLARTDAWMTTALNNIMLEGKGGKRNNHFSDSFQKLIPVALEFIVHEIWNDIKNFAPDELRPRINNSQDVENDPYGNFVRDHTAVMHSVRDDYLYLLASPKYFKEKICSWYGEVKDCFIGRCEMEDNYFKQISTCTTFENDTCDESEIDSA